MAHPRRIPFASAFAAGAVTPAQLLAFHNARFGDLRMEEEDDKPDLTTEEGRAQQATLDAAKLAAAEAEKEKGFPADKPISEMTDAQQAAYWKHQARKHETTSKARADYDTVKAERDKIKAASQTEAEKAVEAAKAEASTSAKVEARNQYVPQLVAAKLEAALAGKMPADKIAAQVDFLDHTKFLTDTGEVDTDKVKQYADGLVPAGGQWPDMGQGKRGGGSGSRPTSVSQVVADRRAARDAKAKQ